MTGTKFVLGQLIKSSGALKRCSSEFIAACLARHCAGDWGIVTTDEVDDNNRAAESGGRLLSLYKMTDGGKLWIVTEAKNEFGDRPATRVFTGEEYYQSINADRDEKAKSPQV